MHSMEECIASHDVTYIMLESILLFSPNTHFVSVTEDTVFTCKLFCHVRILIRILQVKSWYYGDIFCWVKLKNTFEKIQTADCISCQNCYTFTINILFKLAFLVILNTCYVRKFVLL